MSSLDYHPLRIRAVLPGSVHLGDLEARAAARTAQGRTAADVDAYLAEIGLLLDERARARGERPCAEFIRQTALDEALRISKALQWARSTPRVVRVPPSGPPSSPMLGTLRVGGIQLPSPCVYVAFSDDFPTADPDMRISGVYLGEGGSLEALASGWVEYVWALVIAVQRRGEPLGSATSSWHASIATADPTRRVSEALLGSFGGETIAASTVHFGAARNPPSACQTCVAEAIECALLAAAHVCVANVVPASRKPRVIPDATDPMAPSSDAVGDMSVDVAVPPPAGEAAGPRTPAEVVFGPASPRARNRWLVERELRPATNTPKPHPERPEGVSRPYGGAKRKVGGYDRGPHARVYHRDTPREFVKWIAAHPVNGGRAKDPVSTVVVDRLDPSRRPAPRHC